MRPGRRARHGRTALAMPSGPCGPGDVRWERATRQRRYPRRGRRYRTNRTIAASSQGTHSRQMIWHTARDERAVKIRPPALKYERFAMSETGAATTALIEADVREGTYGDRIWAVEPGGVEFIPLAERHGRPHQQFWTWVSPNMEFATVFVGFIAIWFFDQPLPAAIGAIVVG